MYINVYCVSEIQMLENKIDTFKRQHPVAHGENPKTSIFIDL